MPVSPMEQIGRTATTKYGGRVYSEFLRELRGSQGARTYREMRDNDAIIGAVLYAIETLIRGVEWWVEPASEAEEDLRAATFLEEAMDDMSEPWSDTILDAMTMLTYGWAYQETVYKRRMGPEQSDPKRRSKHTDGLISWRKMPVIEQETLDRWEFDEEDDGVRGLWQKQTAGLGKSQLIPIEKALLFKTQPARRSPEGRSVLRNAYKPYFFSRRMEEIEAIGIERDLAGLPVVTLPEDVEMTEDASPEDKAIVDSAQNLVNDIRRDNAEGIVKPQGWELELLSTGGRRQIDVGPVIERYDRRKAMTTLGDVILIGHEAVGSYSLADVKQFAFEVSMNAYMHVIRDVHNLYSIPRLFKLNPSFPQDRHPGIEHAKVEHIDLEKLANFIAIASTSGAITIGEEIENYLRAKANLPDKPEEEEEEPEVDDADDLPEGDDGDADLEDAELIDISKLAERRKHNRIGKGIIAKATRFGDDLKDSPETYEILRKIGKTPKAAREIVAKMRERGIETP